MEIEISLFLSATTARQVNLETYAKTEMVFSVASSIFIRITTK